MFNNNYYNNNNETNITTRLMSLYSDTSSMTLSCWNNKLSISLTPILNIDEQGKRNYDDTKRVSTAIVLYKIKTLMTGINSFILPSIEKVKNGETIEDTNVGIEINKNALFIEYKRDEKDNKYKVLLTLYINISPDNTCNTYVNYQFKQNTLITNYNNGSGTGNTGELESEFLMFVDILNHMVDSIGISHHGDVFTQSIEKPKASNISPQQSVSTQAPIETFDDDDLPF